MDSEERRIHTSTSPDIRAPPRPAAPQMAAPPPPPPPHSGPPRPAPPARPASNSGPEIGKGVLSQRTSSVQISFFNLPGDIRHNIYRRVLVVSHPLFLFQDKGSQVVEIFAPERPFRWLALLYTNRQVHDEACTVLYGLNYFSFMDTTQHQGGLLQSFFNCIGSVNAGLLSHLCINFPVVESVEGQSGNAILREDDMHSLELLQEKCTNLTTLEILIHSRNSRRLINPSHDDSQFVREALTQIDAQLKAISSLKKVIVRSYDGTPTPSVMELMQGLGWVILPGR